MRPEPRPVNHLGASELVRDVSRLAKSRASSLPQAKPTRSFTLLELLVVVGLMATFSVFFIRELAGAGKTAALQSGQALVAGLVTAARTSALASGQSARLLIQVDVAGETTRFLHHAVVQTQTSAGWQTLLEASFPDGVYVVPGNFGAPPAGLFAPDSGVPWTKTDGSALRSTALRANQLIVAAISHPGAEQWVAVTISTGAGTAQSGDLIVAAGRLRPPGSYVAGESPVELVNPELVRGLTLSAYAVPALINGRMGF